MRKSDPGTVKKIEEYSYSLGHGIGKGYSSHVYRGRNDSKGTHYFLNLDHHVAIKVIDMHNIYV